MYQERLDTVQTHGGGVLRVTYTPPASRAGPLSTPHPCHPVPDLCLFLSFWQQNLHTLMRESLAFCVSVGSCPTCRATSLIRNTDPPRIIIGP